VTTPPAVPAPATPPPPGAAPPQRRQLQILWLAAVVVVVALVLRACTHHENSYERIARALTVAVQNNDMAAVKKLENPETAAEMTNARLGRAADLFAPLGKIVRVRETSPQTDVPRLHEFDVAFEKGAVHEKIQFDPDEKIVHFRYDETPTK
jgi:hypothetical protein